MSKKISVYLIYSLLLLSCIMKKKHDNKKNIYKVKDIFVA